MHELSICRALLRRVEAEAAAREAHGVRRVTVRIGPLSGVEPDLLHHAFDTAVRGTRADGATLAIERAPVTVHCRACGARGGAPPGDLRCGTCASTATTLAGGGECLLVGCDLIMASAVDSG